MAHLLIFGLGYTATRLADMLAASGWRISATRREADGAAMAFDDTVGVCAAIASATHILSSVPPTPSGDPVLDRYGSRIAAASAGWIGYLSSTGVYGDSGGAWVDESAPLVGRRRERAQADIAWGALRDDVHRFRLPGIYGPGRSALERLAAGTAHRVSAPGQMFSRIHVDDIVSAIRTSFVAGRAGVYNIADDRPCSQNEVAEAAARLLDLPPPPFVSMAALSPPARAFYAERRRIATGKAKRLLGWAPAFRDYRAGLAAIFNAPGP